EKIKHVYEEVVDTAKRGPKPFTITFQSESDPKSAFVTSSCTYNTKVDYVYYQTPSDAHARYYNDTRRFVSYPGSGQALKPFWDMRYTNSVSKYIDGGVHLEYADHSVNTGLDAREGIRNVEIGTSLAQINPDGAVAQAKCVNGSVAAGTIINLYDAPEQYLTYAGPQSSFKYILARSALTSPWKSDGSGNIMIQANFDEPIYHNFSNNIGGGVYFNLFLHNKRNGKLLNYVIGIYGIGEAWMKEKAGIRFDPTTGVIHVATVIKDSSWWCTKSPSSLEIQEVFNGPTRTNYDDGVWSEFYRVNIAYQNLLAVLKELKDNPPPEAAGEDFGLSPEDWEVTSIMIQYELEEEGGKAILAGSFKDFNAFISKNPL
ncbi:MAG: hypothetical protein GXO02_03605, partial [Epsilonproteobacteria bacterium]|nr:hypothetical protein [Campylobacterota bacterium]